MQLWVKRIGQDYCNLINGLQKILAKNLMVIQNEFIILPNQDIGRNSFSIQDLCGYK